MIKVYSFWYLWQSQKFLQLSQKHIALDGEGIWCGNLSWAWVQLQPSRSHYTNTNYTTLH